MGEKETTERLQIPGVHSSATQPAAMATQLCRNPKVPMLRGKGRDGKEKATTRTHSITEIQKEGRRETWQGGMQEKI